MTAITNEAFLNTQTAKEIIDHTQNDIYKDSSFYNLKIMSSKTKGAKTERLFKEHMRNLGHEVFSSVNSDHDCIVNGHKVEIKSSFMWKGTDTFRFQQIRPSQDYDFIVFMSIRPEQIDLHICDKETARKNLEIQDERGFWIHNQHGGKTKNSGTFFVDCDPNKVQWMEKLENQLNASPRCKSRNT